MTDYPRLPYKGFAPFGPEDHALFVGRQDEADGLTQFLLESPATLLIGPSGSGKTSLLRAAVLLDMRLLGWEVEYVNVHGENVRSRLSRISAQLAKAGPAPRIVVIDHVDNLREAVAAFEEHLEKLAVPSETHFVLVASVDKFGSFEEPSAKDGSRLFDVVVCPPPSSSRLVEFIAAPFRKREMRLHFGGDFAPDLVLGLARELRGRAGEYANLREMQCACFELWRDRMPERLFATRRVEGLLDDYRERSTEMSAAHHRVRHLIALVGSVITLVAGLAIGIIAVVPHREPSGLDTFARFLDVALTLGYVSFFVATGIGAMQRPETKRRVIGCLLIGLALFAGGADLFEGYVPLHNSTGELTLKVESWVKWVSFFGAAVAASLMVRHRDRLGRAAAVVLGSGAVAGLYGLATRALWRTEAAAALVAIGAVVSALIHWNDRRDTWRSTSILDLRRMQRQQIEESRQNFDDQLFAEAEAIAEDRRRNVTVPDTAADDIRAGESFGLALSGGGIRSATFNLGLLQALDALDVLPVFDYLATVSGGGYIGGFWSAWKRRNKPRPADEDARVGETVRRPQAPAFPAAKHRDESEPREIRHLREFSNFLSPRVGILSSDTGRMIVAALGATIPAMAATFALLLLGLGAWISAAWLIIGPKDLEWRADGLCLAILGAIPAAALGAMEIEWQRRGERGSTAYAFASLIGIGTSMLALWLWAKGHPEPSLFDTGPRLLPQPRDAVAEWWELFLPAGAWASGVVVLIVVRWLLSPLAERQQWRASFGAADRATSRILLIAAVWSVISILWIAGAMFWAWLSRDIAGSQFQHLAGMSGFAAALGVAFRFVQKAMTEQPNKPFGSRISAILRPKLPQVIAYATSATLVATAVAVISWLGTVNGAAPWSTVEAGWNLWWAAVVAVIVTLLTLWRFDPNEVGLHSFYRARLARAFLGASNPLAGRVTEAIDTDDSPLDKLSESRPVHLVCCAANDLASRDHLANLHRGSVSSVLSRFGHSVGRDWRPWGPGTVVPTLGSAITASGAAFNSHMGSKSMELGQAVTFLMSAFNLRLGMWLPHPRRGAVRADWFHGTPFYRELFGISRADGKHVLLSDGGHFENMALYELLRRRCRFILASDCGADPDVGFDDLGNLVRRVREDFDIEIDIDVAPLRKGADGRATQPMVAGDIHYPNGNVGVLLLVKPTIVGNEPIDVQQYRLRNPDFPHESTGDQFYDEAQWESYRRLGLHAGNAALRQVAGVIKAESDGRSPSDPTWGSRLFARARMLWQPTPAGAAERLPAIVSRISDLDAELQRSGCARILPQVYREVDELDREVQRRGRRGGLVAPQGFLPAIARLEEPGVLPTEDELAPSLHLMRRAVLFMEEVFVSEELERHYNHPMYLGLINYFARWAYAPVFRMWWPLLRSLYTRRFTAFMERTYGLESILRRGDNNESVESSLGSASAGFADHCWRLDNGRERTLHDDERIVSFNVCMHYAMPSRQIDPYVVQAGVARIRCMPAADGKSTVVSWTSDDFYVPPGLWGMGIGERFLELLLRRSGYPFEGDKAFENVSTFVVGIPRRRGSRGAVRKEGADLTAMYRAGGFSEQTGEDLVEQYGLNATKVVRLKGHTVVLDDVEHDSYRWMRYSVPS